MPDKEFTGKQRMLIDWEMVRNAMLRADSGEMKVTHHKNNTPGGGVVGVVVEVLLQFNEALASNFTEDEKAAIDDAKKKWAEEQEQNK